MQQDALVVGSPLEGSGFGVVTFCGATVKFKHGATWALRLRWANKPASSLALVVFGSSVFVFRESAEPLAPPRPAARPLWVPRTPSSPPNRVSVSLTTLARAQAYMSLKCLRRHGLPYPLALKILTYVPDADVVLPYSPSSAGATPPDTSALVPDTAVCVSVEPATPYPRVAVFVVAGPVALVGMHPGPLARVNVFEQRHIFTALGTIVRENASSDALVVEPTSAVMLDR